MEKCERQAADLGAVWLYQEGLFVLAYNEGAYGFIHQILGCKPMRRFVKSAGEDRVVCGVPFSVVAALPGFALAQAQGDLSWRWPLATTVDPTAYHAWREKLPIQAARKSDQSPALSVPASDSIPACAQNVLTQLLAFDVGSNTPLAALQLVANLQRQWQAE